MRRIFILVFLAVLLAGFNLAVFQKERQLAGGIEVLLRLAPVDPRALLMGDYMTLEYRINNDIRSALSPRSSGRGNRRGSALPASGLAVVSISGETAAGRVAGEAVFARIDDGSPLGPDEAYLVFRGRGRDIITASTAYYFQEGRGRAFERAVFGRLRLDRDGKALLVALCDAAGKDIPSTRDARD